MKWLESVYNFMSCIHKDKLMFGTYLHRMIWLGCVSVCIPVIMTGMVYYNFAINKEKDQIREANEHSLLLIRDRIERILEYIEEISLGLAVDPVINNSITQDDFSNDVLQQIRLLNSITLKRYSNELIGDIIFYNHLSGRIFSSDYGQVPYVRYKYRNDLDLLMQSDQGAKWVQLDIDPKQAFISYARKIPPGEGNPYGLIIIHASIDQIREYMDDSSGFSDDKTIAVLDNNLQTILTSRNANPAQNPSFSAIAQANQAEGFKTSHVITDGTNGQSFIYSHLKSPRGRMYISMIPERALENRLNWIRTYTVVQVLLFIFIGIMLTLYVSKKNYTPIKQLVRFGENISKKHYKTKGSDFDFIRECMTYLQTEAKTLENQTQLKLRERFLQKAFAGNLNTYSEEQLKAECETFGLHPHRNFSVLVTNVEHLYKETRFSPEDRPIISFAVANIMEELLAQQTGKLSGFVLQNNDYDAALLQFNRDMSEEEAVALACKYAVSISAAVEKFLKINISVGIGRLYPHLSDISLSYKEALLALQYRIYKESDSVLYIGSLEQNKRQTLFFYPHDIDEWITSALAKGDMKSAENALGEFIEALRPSESYHLIFQSYHVLLTSIILSIEKLGGSILDLLEYDLYNQLRDRHTSREIYDWFIQVLFPLFQKLTNNGNASMSLICQYIKQNVNSDISLVQCADLIGMSPSYLSRMFKKEVGMSFQEYVMESKVREAKRLLLETDQKISDIALSVGYSERNLNRIFQRFTQMSPRQFRSQNR